ncbi:hypothetical protein C8J57DRAFT_1247448 [Mycena rebaudengoi]|nr:hypothetical protein C8J57DRAFT_1247448 [Mycena rebaudengoi]
MSPPAESPYAFRPAELKASEEAVKSCSLVSHSFVWPSQMKLFSAVDLRARVSTISLDALTQKFSGLSSSSSLHIAPYVKTLLLSYRSDRTDLSKTVGHILSLLGNLVSLRLQPWSKKPWVRLPDFLHHLRDSVAPLSTLQFIEIRHHHFDSASDLQDLLFSSLPRIVIDSPQLSGLRRTDVDELPLHKLLPERSHLHALHLEAYSPGIIFSIIHKLGHLSKLGALKTVTIGITSPSNDIDEHHSWSDIDEFFSQLSGIELEEVKDHVAAEDFRKFLPKVDKGSCAFG